MPFFVEKRKSQHSRFPYPKRKLDFSYLQHLNKRHTQIQIGDISTDQTEAEEQTNGKDGSSVGFAVHRHLVSGIENGGEFGQTLGHDCGEEHVPCRQEEWEFCFFSISISKSTHNEFGLSLFPEDKKEEKKEKKRGKRKKEHTKLRRMQHPFIKKNHTSRQTNPKPTKITQSANQKNPKLKTFHSFLFPTPAKIPPIGNETVVTIRNIKRRM